MQLEEFDKVCDNLSERRQAIMDAKRPEYVEGHVDILHNFKILAEELNVTPMQVWYVYFRKHIASIGQYCADEHRNLSEPIESRIADAMNYLELGAALIEEATWAFPAKAAAATKE